MEMLARLTERCRQGTLEPLEVHFARLMDRLDGRNDPALALGAALTSHLTASGHVCADLRELAGRPVLEAEGLEPLLAPELDPWLAGLRDSPVVGAPGEFRPLVLDPVGRLYLHRYWDYERQLAADLLERSRPGEEIDEARLKADLAALFPPIEPSGTDWQRVAAATAVLQRLAVISGGPGTGKTTTVTRILALLLSQEPSLRIRLAAPTGKAAGRMQEAIRQAKERLPLSEAVREAIPEQAATLHRLLGWRPGAAGFRHGPDNPLALDVLVVDEASMVDLALMARLLGALPEEARLILLGDKDQLASVEAGAVLADICGPVPGFRAPFRRRLEPLLGQSLPKGKGDNRLADCVVLLRHSYRFGADSGIGSLARRVNAGDGAGALGVLGEGFEDIDWQPLEPRDYPPPGLEEVVTEGFRPYLEQVRRGAEPADIFRAFEGFRVLCALRQGPAGVTTLNDTIQGWLANQRLIRPRSQAPAQLLAGWYPGRPVMITRNDYNLRLYNGDIGICLEDQGQLRVCFLSAQGELRHFPPGRLPEHETVYAMTVHKSQGSEFDRVLLLLPPEPSRIMTRELLYTGITRARQHLQLWGPEGVLRAAAGRRLHRSSGLGDRLWGRED